MKLLGLDPGQSTGYALIEVDGGVVTLVDFGVELKEEVTKVHELILQADIVICEDFKIRPDKARAGNFDYNNMVAPRVIGKIELLCSMSQTKLVKQQPSVKPPAYGLSGMQYVKGKKNQHWQDAFAHAVYYAVKNLGASPLKHG